VLAEIAQQTSFQEAIISQHRLGRIGVHARTTNTPAQRLRGEAGRHARSAPHAHALAEGGMFLNAHVEMRTRSALPRRVRTIQQGRAIKGLAGVYAPRPGDRRAACAHEAARLYAGLHSRPLIQGALMHKVHGERAWDMAPFRRVQDTASSGDWSDATAVRPQTRSTRSGCVTGR